MILLIDNYDSFTFNLYQQIGIFTEEIVVRRNDRVTIQEIEDMKPAAIIISPGPGRPEDAGIIVRMIQHFYRSIPILGICLGHQAIALAFDGEVVSAKSIMHGKMSSISHDGDGVFQCLPQQIEVMRYHSLAVDNETLPSSLVVTARTEDGEIMAMRHRDHQVIGIQFHPESIGTKDGSVMIENFLLYSKIITKGDVVV